MENLETVESMGETTPNDQSNNVVNTNSLVTKKNNHPLDNQLSIDSNLKTQNLDKIDDFLKDPQLVNLNY